MTDLLEFAQGAERLVAKGKSAWDRDEFLRLAGEALLMRIGEAVSRVDRDDPELVATHPEINWRAMKAIRNVVAHEYGSVDYEILWAALKDNVPREADAVAALLASSN